MFSLERLGDGKAWKCMRETYDELYKRLKRLFDEKGGGYGYGGFPGSMPVSLERRHIPILRRESFWVTEKTDGERWCLWATIWDGKKVCIAFDRSFRFFLLNLKCSSWVYEDTILDGELVYDRVTQSHVFLVFDCLFFQGKDQREYEMSSRIHAYQKVVKSCRDGGNFSIEAKTYTRSVTDVVQHDRWNVDGLIFVLDAQRDVGDQTIEGLKWKRTHTVDFLLDTSSDDHICAYVYRKDGLIPVTETVKRSNEFRENVQMPRVVECKYDKTTGYWTTLHERTDKTTPNSYSVYKNTMRAIHEDIRIEELASIGLSTMRSTNDLHR